LALRIAVVTAFLFVISPPCTNAEQATQATDEKLKDHLSNLESLVDADAEGMKFRFRTKFNRKYDPDQNNRVLVAKKTDNPPILDGILDDNCWKAEGTQDTWKHRTHTAWVKPATTTPGFKQTVLYVCYDEKNLYFAFVAEEPEPKSVIFGEKHEISEDHWKGVYYGGDCGELFIETGGFGGDGHIWQFIFNIYDHMTYDAPSPSGKNGMAWKSGVKLKGAMGPKRWIVEMSIPFKGFAWDDYRLAGTPKRGELWGLRVVRDGRPPATAYSRGSGSYEERFFNTWTYNPIEAWANPWPTGALYFDDINLLRNGAFNEDLDNDGKLDHWQIRKSTDDLDAGLSFDEELGFGAVTCKLTNQADLFQVSQVVDVIPGKFYSLTGKIKVESGQGEVIAGFQSPARKMTITEPGKWHDLDLEIFTGADQKEANLYLLFRGRVEKVLIDELVVRQQPFGTEEGVYCLTGNAFRPELNVRDSWNIKGRYTYREPDSGEFLPPSMRKFPNGLTAGKPDLGIGSVTDGWLPFDKGSLTKGGHNFVQWPWNIQANLIRPTYPYGHEEIFDLGRDFYVTGIDSLFASSVKHVSLYVKPEKADGFLLVNRLNGPGVLHPRSDTIYVRFRGINSVGRYLKLHWIERTLEGGSQYFMQIWGTKKGDHGDLEVTRFRWKEGITVKKPKVPSFSRIRKPFIVPQPRQITWSEGPYVVSSKTRIVCQQQGLAMGIGKDFADDTARIHAVRLPVVALEEELKSNPALADCIVIGDVGASPQIARIANEAGLKITPTDPGQQGYALVVDARRVLVIGSGEDQHGAYYGISSVMQLLRRDADSRLIVPGCRVRDWPNVQVRGAYFQYFDHLRLGDDLRQIISLYGLMRVNRIEHARPRIHLESGNEKQLAAYKDLRGYLRRHYMTWAQPGDYWGRSARNQYADKNMIHIEMMDDEDDHMLREKTNLARLNVCPSSSHGYYLNRDLVHAMSDQLNETEAVSLNTDEMNFVNDGSRWNACRRCLRRGLDGPDLFYEYYVRFYDLARRNGVKMETIDTMLTPDGGNSRYNNMGDAYPYIPRDMTMVSWKGSIGKPHSNPEYAIDHFDRLLGINAWGYRENYGDPYGGPSPDFKQKTNRRIGGSIDSYWGAGSNQGMILGPLAKAQGGQAMAMYYSHPVGAEFLWSPANPMPNTFEFANRMVNLTVRLNERYFARPFPSWQEDRTPKWFKVALNGTANWSHIDELPADGKGWLDWGSNYDLRQLPTGDTKIEEVPFRIIEPSTNNGRSIIFLANYPEGSELAPALPRSVREIQIERSVASLCFLKMRVGAGYPASFVAVYEDGRELTFNLDVRDQDVASSYRWDHPHNYEQMERWGKSITKANPFLRHIDFMSRPGWFGYTTCGDECSARIHEWVNPYPELPVKSIRIFYPLVQITSERTAVLAISGIEAEEQDVERWSRKARPPLRPSTTPYAALRKLKPLLIGGEPEFKTSESGYRNATGRYLEEKGEALYAIEAVDGNNTYRALEKSNRPCFLGGISQGKRKWQVNVRILKPSPVKAVAFCGRFSSGMPRNKKGAGTFKLARADYTIKVRTLDGKWQQVGQVRSACGEDGLHYFAVPSLTIDRIQAEVSVTDAQSNVYYQGVFAPGISYLQAYGE